MERVAAIETELQAPDDVGQWSRRRVRGEMGRGRDRTVAARAGRRAMIGLNGWRGARRVRRSAGAVVAEVARAAASAAARWPAS